MAPTMLAVTLYLLLMQDSREATYSRPTGVIRRIRLQRLPAKGKRRDGVMGGLG